MTDEEFAAKIAEGMTKGSAEDQKQAKNAGDFTPGDHMDESYLENDNEAHTVFGVQD